MGFAGKGLCKGRLTGKTRSQWREGNHSDNLYKVGSKGYILNWLMNNLRCTPNWPVVFSTPTHNLQRYRLFDKECKLDCTGCIEMEKSRKCNSWNKICSWVCWNSSLDCRRCIWLDFELNKSCSRRLGRGCISLMNLDIGQIGRKLRKCSLPVFNTRFECIYCHLDKCKPLCFTLVRLGICRWLNCTQLCLFSS